MTDLTTLFHCITGLIICFSTIRFLRWFINGYYDSSELIEKVEMLEKENADLKRKAVNNSDNELF